MNDDFIDIDVPRSDFRTMLAAEDAANSAELADEVQRINDYGKTPKPLNITKSKIKLIKQHKKRAKSMLKKGEQLFKNESMTSIQHLGASLSKASFLTPKRSSAM
jgi:hypothetical protein